VEEGEEEDDDWDDQTHDTATDDDDMKMTVTIIGWNTLTTTPMAMKTNNDDSDDDDNDGLVRSIVYMNKPYHSDVHITHILDPNITNNHIASLTSCVWLLYFSANAAFIATMAAKQGIHSKKMKEYAMSQINYMLGDNKYNMSFEVGFGNKYPKRIQHRAR